MTKREVLEIIFTNARAISPDTVCRQLRGFHWRSSVYSYLFRLHRQGLLNRKRVAGRLAYEISLRGVERLNYLKQKEKSHGK